MEIPYYICPRCYLPSQIAGGHITCNTVGVGAPQQSFTNRKGKRKAEGDASVSNERIPCHFCTKSLASERTLETHIKRFHSDTNPSLGRSCTASQGNSRDDHPHKTNYGSVLKSYGEMGAGELRTEPVSATARGMVTSGNHGIPALSTPEGVTNPTLPLERDGPLWGNSTQKPGSIGPYGGPAGTLGVRRFPQFQSRSLSYPECGAHATPTSLSEDPFASSLGTEKPLAWLPPPSFNKTLLVDIDVANLPVTSPYGERLPPLFAGALSYQNYAVSRLVEEYESGSVVISSANAMTSGNCFDDGSGTAGKAFALKSVLIN